ncbi:MAG: serine protein kinase RIO [Thaumarchaeota archaeon]|nr:serine protein kinase RIO [Candidatus Geocrenenecus arthurdayi]MCL7391041.1 serine protein kinase RIO [Candidatus Geocrenenecus arthurdayi]MCL7396737.1 serine protein kinase RIO [Candidatus Geocrenenecus arthurdayi]
MSKAEKKLWRRLYKYDREQRYLRKRSELDEALEEVFDQTTLMTIYSLMKKGLIKEFYGVVSAGKESRIYLAKDSSLNYLAVKIYLVASAEFRKNRVMYVSGDPRFKRIPNDFRKFIYLWARREYSNLEAAYNAGVPVPKPLFVENNVLGMSFIGEDEKRYPTLAEVKVERNVLIDVYPQVIDAVEKLYHGARLVHGDLSEYNIFLLPENHIAFIDLSQAVHVEQPQADQLLLRDLKNIARYFKKNGLQVEDYRELFKKITGRIPVYDVSKE